MTIQTGMIKSTRLKAAAVYTTASHCIRALCVSYAKPLTQKNADRRIKAWAECFLNIAKPNIRVSNPFNVRLDSNKRYIIMCNHTSLYDIPLGYMVFPDISLRMLAKKELTRIPIFGRTMRALGTPIIDRHNRDQAVKDLEKTKTLMNQGIVLWIAPEGTRSRTGELKAFKKGGFITAIQADATIIPLAIIGANKICPNDNSRVHLYQNVELTIGKPINAGEYDLENKEKLIAKVHKAIKELLH